MKLLSNRFTGELFLNHIHKDRFYHVHHKQDIEVWERSPSYLAVIFLLTADEVLWNISENAVCLNGFDFSSIHLRQISTEGYALYQTAKTISTGKEYIQQCKSERESNEEYLKEFESNLKGAGLSANTIARHLSNIDFYINEYLLREEPLEMREGCYCVDDFLGYFFIRKCMWSTPGTIKNTAASLKKFYKCMESKGNVQKDEYQELCNIIKENMDIWQDDCERFNNPSIDNPFGYI